MYNLSCENIMAHKIRLHFFIFSSSSVKHENCEAEGAWQQV